MYLFCVFFFLLFPLLFGEPQISGVGNSPNRHHARIANEQERPPISFTVTCVAHPDCKSCCVKKCTRYCIKELYKNCSNDSTPFFFSHYRDASSDLALHLINTHAVIMGFSQLNGRVLHPSHIHGSSWRLVASWKLIERNKEISTRLTPTTLNLARKVRHLELN